LPVLESVQNRRGIQYIVPVTCGSRVFAPRPFTTLLTIALLFGLAWLGVWQLRRAEQKRAVYAAFAVGADATLALERATPSLPRYQHVEATGAYDPARQILIDNMINAQGRAGYYVITPFELQDGGWVLVNRGWVPVGASRAEKPQIAVGPQIRELRGRTDNMPVAGIRLGDREALAPPYPVVANFPTRAEIERLLRLQESDFTNAAELVLLDPGAPDGYLREWHPAGFPPERHIAYAVQWFGLALALAVIYVVTNLQRVTAQGGASAARGRP
jgi:surfeit locus 1 family protein